MRNSFHGERSYLIWTWTKLWVLFILWNVYEEVCLFQSYFLSSSRAVRNTSKGAGSRLAAEKSTGVFASHPWYQDVFPWVEEQVFLTRINSPHQNHGFFSKASPQPWAGWCHIEHLFSRLRSLNTGWTMTYPELVTHQPESTSRAGRGKHCLATLGRQVKNPEISHHVGLITIPEVILLLPREKEKPSTCYWKYICSCQAQPWDLLDWLQITATAFPAKVNN